ncbi:MAG: adenylosuccinate synthase [Phycisphaerales bacterium]|jgi:adenylosuccinate synthase|nr:adenylosuccinate synthase [Phycisphaerales bacterium]
MNSNNVTVVGLQWGDEGKGKIVDALAANSDMVSRYCGGANAGHTVKVGDEKYAVHLVPCGILHEGVMNCVGNGMAFDPVTALGEVEHLQGRGVHVGPDNFSISEAAQVVMPWHKLQDTLNEESLGKAKIGTTARGIGPCYCDKANRSTAIRVADLLDADGLTEKIARVAGIKQVTFEALYNYKGEIDVEGITAEFIEIGKKLAPHIRNTGALLRRATAEGKRVLFEGGQGTMLDIDHGTYPFVTSSSVSACGVPAGAGVAPKSIGTVVGIMKAYTTRVGAGPFPTELDNEIGDAIRKAGNEFGTTTGRPRRCGWFDAMVVKYTADLSGVDELAVMLLDVLSGLDELKICVGYKVDGVLQEDFDPANLADVECVYETLPGWSEDITGVTSYDDLPANAKAYVTRVSEVVGRKVGIVSIGPDRKQTLVYNTGIEGIFG